MSSGELLQTIQFLLMMLAAIIFMYHLVRNFSYFRSVVTKSFLRISCKNTLLYMLTLSVLDYECFHKLQIWRYYRFSQVQYASST